MDTVTNNSTAYNGEIIVVKKVGKRRELHM